MTARTAVRAAPRPRSAEVTLTIEGDLDLAAARRVARGRRAGARVVVDLRAARRVDDAALAALVRGITGCPLEVIGLSRHHERLLRYLAEDSRPIANAAQPARKGASATTSSR